MNKQLLNLSALILAGGILAAGHARADTADVTVNISGTIVIPPCEVNSGQPITVDFGDIVAVDVANSVYRRTMSVPVTCDYYEGTPYVMVTGTPLSGAGTNVLQTNIANFGIALYQGSDTSTELTLGSGSSNIGYAVTSGLTGTNTASGTFAFTAVPYQLGTGTLDAGTFSASATLSISYM